MVSPVPPFQNRSSRIRPGWLLVLTVALLLVIYPSFIRKTNNASVKSAQHYKPLGAEGTYTGKPWSTPQTISKITAAETKFARCDMHTVRTEDGTIIDDWLFFEEKNAINVIVLNADGKFVVFEQRKYAIDGLTYSPVGGFIDDGEFPYDAAKREVLEELGLGSPRSSKGGDEIESGKGSAEKMETKGESVGGGTWNPDGSVTDGDPDWVFLGTYRTAANRGGGFIYLYLLKNAVPLVQGGGTSRFKGSGDDEGQKILFLSEKEIFEAIGQARFQEVKWAAAMSLAMLHIREGLMSQ